jgi:hypothetical protein
VRVATHVPARGRVIAWSELGAYRTITALIGATDPAAMLPDSVVRLLSAHDAATLAGSLETYLEHAGDAQATAAALSVHRSSLYHRLHRIEQVTGMRLRVGDDRLELHLGLRMWRLAGSPTAEHLKRSNSAAPSKPSGDPNDVAKHSAVPTERPNRKTTHGVESV